MQGKDLLFLTCIHAMPIVGGQPLPRRLFTCPALGIAATSSPRSVTSRRSIDFTGRWASLSRFCADPEGADQARGGVVPRSHRSSLAAGVEHTVAAIFLSPKRRQMVGRNLALGPGACQLQVQATKSLRHARFSVER